MRDKQTNKQQTVKIELLSQWKLEAEIRKIVRISAKIPGLFILKAKQNILY